MQRLRVKNPSAPVFKLLDSAGGKTLAESAYILMNGRRVCDCGKTTPFRTAVIGFAKYCGRACAHKDPILQTKAASKRAATMVARYGGASTMGSAVLFARVQQTNLERYGSRSPMQHAGVREKAAKTILSKYGGASPNASPKVAERQSAAQRYTADRKKLDCAAALGMTIISGEVMAGVAATWRCAVGHEFQHRWSTAQCAPICRRCHPYTKGTSGAEIELAEFVRSLVPIEVNKRVYVTEKSYREMDIFVPSKNLAIEYNGLYWHSELAGRGPEYHLEKLEVAERHGIRLLQIFEHEWTYKREICKSVISAKLGFSTNSIGARKLKLHEVTKKQAQSFLERTHLAGSAQFSTALGLFQNDELVCCTTWGADRFGRSNALELIRFSTELGFSVPGGLSRLTKAALQRWPNRPLKSFCDRRFGNGNGYLQAGWIQVGQTRPGYWYFKNNQVFHRLQVQKRRLQQLTDCYDKTEWELAQQAGYNRFWDCGNFIFKRVN